MNVWVKAIILDFLQVAPGLTDQTPEQIKAAVKGHS